MNTCVLDIDTLYHIFVILALHIQPGKWMVFTKKINKLYMVVCVYVCVIFIEP